MSKSDSLVGWLRGTSVDDIAVTVVTSVARFVSGEAEIKAVNEDSRANWTKYMMTREEVRRATFT